MAETPRFAHFVVLLFLGSGFAVAVSLITALVAALSKATRVARIAAGSAALFGFGYMALLMAVSLTSQNKTLRTGEWKYFCEADCHIAYSIAEVRYAATLGQEAKPLTAQGQFAVVRLRTWFDEHSIAPWRGDAPLTPDARVAMVVDEAGHRYEPLGHAVGALGISSTPLNQALRPGETYETTFVFDLPRGVASPRFLIADEEPVTRLLVDHENSPLHGKIYLSLDATMPQAAANRR